MFERLKQESCEKTGRLQGTNINTETESKIKYCKEWVKRDRQLLRAVDRCAAFYKKDKRREEIVKHLDIIQRHSDGPMHTGALALSKCLSRKSSGDEGEPRKRLLTSEELNKHFGEKLKLFAAVEMKSMKQAFALLGRKRLNKDALQNKAQKNPIEENQRKAAVAETEFLMQLHDVEELLEKIPEYEALHAAVFRSGLQYLSTAF
ncbi:unnamed protein product [Cylicocyclus nassatus]|uniref:Uncharacterized protein n=1 Tax=Cylicocyclus nassatus TaxID=53992 RepID=A0AA36M2J3_CYLNA|nr:unnamed protein product [Cylicocyclus nassatus]